MGIDGKINVCHLISGDLWAGAEVQAYLMLRSLSQLPEINLTAIILNEGKLAEQLRKAGLEVTVIDESVHGFFSILKQIREYLKNKNISILHSHRYKENILGALLKKRGTVQHLVQTVHGLDETFKGTKKLKAWLYTFLNHHFTKKYFDKVQAVSSDIQNRLTGKIDAARLLTIHNSVSTADIKVTGSSGQVRAELGISENQPVIGSAGRMVPVKRYDDFLKAAKIILDSRPQARFVLAGDGPLLDGLRALAGKLGIRNEVVFTGFRDDVLDVINTFDIFAVSSLNEGIPMVVLEAMALEKPIVTTNVGGMPEIISDNISGFLVDQGDIRGLASACIRLLDDSALRRKIGQASRKRVEEEFSSETQRDRLLKLYIDIIGR